MRTPRNAAQKFLQMAVASETDECILWPYRKTPPLGYATVTRNGRKVNAAGVVLEMTAGPRPAGMVCAHLPVVCHNPSCINPRHLRWATVSENQNDKKLDGTERVGLLNRKLRPEQVAEIRTRYADGGVRQQDLAEEFSVDQTTISEVIRNKEWGVSYA